MVWRRAERERVASVRPEDLARIAHPLESARDLDRLIDAVGDAHYVLLGEASHGTS